MGPATKQGVSHPLICASGGSIEKQGVKTLNKFSKQLTVYIEKQEGRVESIRTKSMLGKP